MSNFKKRDAARLRLDKTLLRTPKPAAEVWTPLADTGYSFNIQNLSNDPKVIALSIVWSPGVPPDELMEQHQYLIDFAMVPHMVPLLQKAGILR